MNPSVAVAALGALALLAVTSPAHGLEQKPVPLKLKSVDAEWAAKKLHALLGGGPDVQLQSDLSLGVVFIWASEEKVRRAKEILSDLDVPAHMFLVHVRHADAAKVARELERLVGDDRTSIVPLEGMKGTLLVTATERKRQEILEALLRLESGRECK